MGEEITDEKEIEEILLNSPYLRLGMCRDNIPYIVPIAFGYKDGIIYLHGSKKGMKMDFLEKNSNVCFEAGEYLGIIPSENPCSYDMSYRSVVGFGTAKILTGEEEKQNGLGVIVERYHGKEYDPKSLNVKALAVIRIDIEKMTGRKN